MKERDLKKMMANGIPLISVESKKVKIPTVSANALTKHCLRILDLRGYFCWRQNNGAVYDKAKECYRKNPQHLLGVPDIIGFHKKTGVFICVEIKAGNDKLSVSQREFLKITARSNALQFVVRNMDDLEAMNKDLFGN